MTGYYDEIVGEVHVNGCTVHEADDLVDTGLLDATGKPIFKTERILMGFDISRPRYRVKAITRRI